MKSISILIAMLIVFFPAPSHALSSYPDVSLVYGEGFDQWCSNLIKEPVPPAATKQLDDQIESFRAAWRNDASALLSTTVSIIGVPFKFHEAQATLVFCGFPSMGEPLLVNMRAFIPATAGNEISSKAVFANTLFHMMAGRYLNDVFDSHRVQTTPLLEKYRGELKTIGALSLYYYALETVVYEKLGRTKELDAVKAHEHLLKSAKYLERAREIVAKEGAENILRDLREK